MSINIHKLNKTQIYTLQILKSVLSAAHALNISCWMQGGTMLGAIRHKGFIPWDDDVDLGIMRDEYNIFVNEVNKYLPNCYELRTYWDNSDHHYYFARVVDKRHEIKRMGSAETRIENIWVDIFPLDGMPNNTSERLIHMFNLSWSRFLYHLSTIEKVNIKRPGRPLLEKIVIKIALSVRPFLKLDTIRLLNNIDLLLKKYPVNHSKYILNFTGQTSFRFNEMIPMSVYGKGTYYIFENIKMLGPDNYNAYLSSLYGDYMTPPKDKEKNAHISEFIK